MLRIISIALLLLTLSCKSGEGNFSDVASYPEIQFIPKDTDGAREVAAAPLPLPLPVPVPVPGPNVPLVLKTPTLSTVECKAENNPTCPEEEHNNPFQCTIIKNNGNILPDDEQTSGFGNSLCQAKKTLYLNSCSSGTTLAEPFQIACHPYDNLGDCPATEEICGQNIEPSRCHFEKKDDEELSLQMRPATWGRNECDARNKLKRKVCNMGLSPKDMQNIKCEKEESTAVCPPIWQNCAPDANGLNKCTLRKIGEFNLPQPIVGLGGNQCEASFRVKELACKTQKIQIRYFNDIECKAELTKVLSETKSQ